MPSSASKTNTAIAAAVLLYAAGITAARADDTGTTPTITTPAPTTSATPPAASSMPTPPAALSSPPKETPVAQSPYVTVNGLIDFYYQYQFNNPKGGHPLSGRIYAFRHNTPTLGLAWVDIAHTPKPGEFGFKFSLAAGDSADSDVPNAQSGTGEAQFKNLAQAYGTYVSDSNFTVDFGKFLSPYGYDTTEAILNPNYTVTLATYLVPNYLFGARATYPIKGANLAVSGFVVNSLEETPTSGVQEDNGRKDFIVRLNYTTPDGKFNYIPAYGFGRDKLSAGFTTAAAPPSGNEDIILFDNWLTYHATKDVTLAGEYVYRKDSDKGGGYGRRGDGYGLYYRQQLDPKNAVAFRTSMLSNKTSVGLVSDSVRVNEITATFEQKVASNLTMRYEYRHDHSNNPTLFGFQKSDGVTLGGDQDAILVAGLFTF